MVEFAEPVLHEYVTPPVAVSVAVLPAQILVPPVIGKTGNELAVSVTEVLLEQVPFVTVTE